jgi:hypothetical protein
MHRLKVVRDFWARELAQIAPHFFGVSEEGRWQIILNNEIRVDSGGWRWNPRPPASTVMTELDKFGFRIIGRASTSQSCLEFPLDWGLDLGLYRNWPGQNGIRSYQLPVVDGLKQQRGIIGPLSSPYFERSPQLTLMSRLAKERTDIGRRLATSRLWDRKNRVARYTKTWCHWGNRNWEELEGVAENYLRRWLTHSNFNQWQNPFWGWAEAD